MNNYANMQTLSSVMEKLRLKGIDKEFTFNKTNLVLGNKEYSPEDLLIIKTFRFEGASDPDDNSVLYLIETNDGKIGYTIDAYGVYSNHQNDGYDATLRKIKVNEREEQQIWED